MSVAHDAHTRFPTPDPGTNLSNVDTTTGDRSFTHTPSGTPAGVVVVILSDGTAQPITGVTYGGISMTLGPSATDTSETGSVWVYTLSDQTIPTGAQTVVLQGCNGSGKWATCSTVTSALGATTVVGSGSKNTTIAAGPNCTVVTSAEAMLYGGVASGQAAIASISPSAGYTLQNINDYGVKVAETSRSTSAIAAGSLSYSFGAASDDYCIAAVALGELSLAGRQPRNPVTNLVGPGLI